MQRTTITALRAALAVVLAGTLLAQAWFFPTLAAECALVFPEVAWLRWPMLVTAILVIAAVQVALGCLWVLLTMTRRGTVFSVRAFHHVDVMIGLIVADTVAIAAVNVYLTFGLRANPPAMFLGLTGLTVCGVAAALLMAVMKGLLRKATRLEAELSEVI